MLTRIITGLVLAVLVVLCFVLGPLWLQAIVVLVAAGLCLAELYTMAMPEMLKDMEFTVVHELIHLELASLPFSEASRRTEETAVNNLTRALLGSAGE